jgi:hypothetical protein
MIRRHAAPVACFLLASSIAPAQAARDVEQDAKGDMVRMTGTGFQDVPHMRSGDITRFTTSHRTRRVTLTTRFTVRPSTFYFLGWTIVTPDHTYEVSRYKFGPSTGWTDITEDGADEPFDCPGLRLRARGDHAIALTIPRTCLHDPAWVRTGHGSFVDRDDTGHYDDARRDDSFNIFKRKLGPKVGVG